MKRFSALFLFLGVLLLAVLFLSKGFFGGQIIQGGDIPWAHSIYYANMAKDTISVWLPFHWMGWDGGTLAPGVQTLMSKLMPVNLILPFTFTFVIALAFIFMFLFLRKMKLSVIPAAFGAAAWSLSPVFLSFIPGGHYTVIEMLPYPPAMFFFLSILLDREEKDKFKLLLAVVGAGASWGMTLGCDIQRGLYISIFAVVFLAIRLLGNHGFTLKTMLAPFSKKAFWMDVLKVAAVGIVLMLSFANGIQRWYGAFQSRENLSQAGQKTAAEKWSFSSSYSHYPLDFVDNIAFGYFGLLSGDQEKPYWGGRQSGGEFKGNSTALGFFVFLFMILGIAGYFFRDKMVHIFFWGGAAALLLSFGRFVPGTPFFWLFVQLPFMDRFRAPEKWMSLVAFTWSVVAAFGLNYVKTAIEEDSKKFFDVVLRALGILFGAGLVWLFFLLANQVPMGNDLGQKAGGNFMAGAKMADNAILSIIRMLVLTVISFTGFFLLQRFREKKAAWHVFSFAFLALLTLELFNINGFFVKRAWSDPARIYQPDGVVQFLGNEQLSELFRVGTALKMTDGKNVFDAVPTVDFYQKPTGIRGYYVGSVFTFYGLEPFDILASSGIPADYTTFMSTVLQRSMHKRIENVPELIDANIRLFQLANVKYVLFDEAYGILSNKGLLLTNIAQSADGKKKYVYFVEGYLPRASFYQDYIAVKTTEDSLKYTADPTFDVRSIAVVKADVKDHLVGTNAAPAEILKIRNYKPWRFIVDTKSASDGVATIMTRYLPDWKATVDGKPAPVIQVNTIGFGVFLTAGNHTVEFRFEPGQAAFWISFYVLMAFLALSAIYGVKWLLKKD